MSKTSILTLTRKNILSIVLFSSLIASAVVVPLFHYQPITGPIVNATLFIAAATLGTSTAITIGLIPSIIALSVGLLAPALAPMIPFIMLSNAILIVTFVAMKDSSYWMKIAVASSIKFIFLAGTSTLVVNLILNEKIAGTVAQVLSWPQLLTALAGGVIAYPIIRLIKR